MTKETYYSEKCVAKKWGLSQKTLQRWRLTGEGPEYVRISNRVRYAESAIKKYEDEHFLEPRSVINPNSLMTVIRNQSFI